MRVAQPRVERWLAGHNRRQQWPSITGSPAAEGMHQPMIGIANINAYNSL